VSVRRATPEGGWKAVDTRGPLRRAGAFLVAGLLLATVVGWLLVSNHRAAAQRRADVLAQHASTLELAAVVAAHAIDSAEGSLGAAALSPAMTAFLEGVELGMSEQYGLAMARAGISDQLRQLTRPDPRGGDILFDRVALHGLDGSRMLEFTGSAGDPVGGGPAPGGGNEGIFISADGTQVLVARPVVVRGTARAVVSGQVAQALLARVLAHPGRPGATPVHLHLVDATGTPYRGKGIRHAAPLPDGAHRLSGDGLGVPVTGSPEGEGRGLLAARVPLRGRSLSVVDVHPVAEIFQDVPSEGASANLAVAVALVLGAVVLGVVLNVRSLVRRTRLEESSAREREVGEKTEALEREAAERQRLERTRAVLANALEQSADAVAIADTALRIEHVNPAFERLVGRPAAALRDTTLLDVMGPQAEATAEGTGLLAALREGRPWRGELAGMRADGSAFDARVSAAQVRDGARKVTHHVFSVRDVTQEKREKENRRHAQKLEAIGTLAGGVAHDFNNLLTAINGYASLGIESLPPGDPLREDLEEIRRAGARASDLTRQLLAFGRRQVLKAEPLDAGEVVLGVQKMLGRLLGETIHLVTELQPATWRVRADRGQVEQVLVNLAVNARDAMPSGGRLGISTANVVVTEREAARHAEGMPGEFVRLRVSDTGVGMPPEVLARVFEPFFTTKEAGKGTGLGLSTVYGIVHQSRGFVGVKSAPGAGTTFDVYLPRDAGPAVPESRDAGPEADRAAAGEVVLVAEDEDQVRSLIVSRLAARGYAVLSAADGREALRVAEQRRDRIDVLVADVVMPRLSGPELARLLRRTHPETVTVFISGYAEEPLFREGAERDAAFLSKPFEVDELCRLIRSVLDRPDRDGFPDEANSCQPRHPA
jgi:PAS domain S-box-containing protein